jgi:hypothetical protein
VQEEIRNDGWVSVVSGIGDASRDKRMSAQFLPSGVLYPAFCRQLFEGDFFSHRAAAIFPEEALKEPCRFVSDRNPHAEDLLNEELLTPDFIESVTLSASLGQAMGGALLWPIYLRDMDPDAPPLWGPPVMGSPIRKWKIIERDSVGQLDRDAWGDVSVYGVSLADTGNYLRLSADRLVRFPGATTTPRTKIGNDGWDLSIYQRIYEQLRDAGMSLAGISILLQSPAQAVFKMQGLTELAGQGSWDTIAKRIAAVETQRSAARPIAIDTNDSFDIADSKVQGLDAIINKQMEIISAVVGAPITLLFGRSAAGMNATGEADFRGFYAKVAVFRRQKIEPSLLQCARLFLLSKNIIMPSDLKLEWDPLWEPTDQERAQTFQSNSAALVSLVTAGIISPAEARSALEGAEKSTGIELSDDTDLEALAANVMATLPQPGGVQ